MKSDEGMRSAVERAVEIIGGPSAVGRLYTPNITHSAVLQWIAKGRCPAERVIALEVATGGAVKRQELRPDLHPVD